MLGSLRWCGTGWTVATRGAPSAAAKYCRGVGSPTTRGGDGTSPAPGQPSPAVQNPGHPRSGEQRFG
ncbi:MAG: hypothetical protein K6U89_19840, partial [Chloroflexi bacterium]|nr:hypothetical protein [Chloroflexota bacterium]